MDTRKVCNLYTAVQKNEVDEVKRLLDEGKDPNEISWENNGRPLIIEAVCHGNVNIVNALIRADVDVNARNVQGETALHFASQARYFKEGIADLLLDHKKTDLNVQENLSGNAPLHIYIKTFSANSNSYKKSMINILEKMIRNSDVNIRNHRGESFLHRMVTSIPNCTEYIELLLSCGADINVLNERRETPLVCAIDQGYDKTASFLIKQGTNLQLLDRYSQTALHHAAQRDRVAVTSLLLESECSVNGQDINGDTALHLAACKGNAEVVRLLLSHPSIGVDIPNVSGATPLHNALENKCFVIEYRAI